MERRRPAPPEIERLVRAWQGPVYGWSLRMLGNAAEAEDAAQETFLRVFDRWGAYDATREFGPWIHRVATRVVLNRLRGERRRRAREGASAAESRDAAPPEESVERTERERIVEEHVRRLPPDERAVVVLHYYSGLSQADVAQALDVPRTTVQSRVARALDALRGSLGGAHAALAGGFEAVMRGTPAPAVPERLTQALVRSACASASASPVVLTVGGILVTKKILFAAVALTFALLAGGYAAGRATAPSPGPDSRAGLVSAEEHARVVAELGRLKREDAERSARALASARPAGQGGPETTAPAGPGSATADPATPAVAAPAGAGDGAVDWSRFGRLFAPLVELLAKAPTGEDGPYEMGEWSPEDRRKMMEALVEYERAALQASALSPTPFFDERVLPGLVEALFTTPLGLSADARKTLDQRVHEALRGAQGDVARATGRPLELHAVRRRVVFEILDAVARAVPSELRERHATVEEAAREMLLGARARMSLSLVESPTEAQFAARVVQSWTEHYDLDERQADAVRPAAEEFARRALEVWRVHGLDRAGAEASPAALRAAEDDVLRAQIDADRKIDALLTEKQRAAVRAEPPLLVLPTSRDHDTMSSTFGSGV